MASIWVESLGRTFEHALDALGAAVTGCSDEQWESGMWQVSSLGPNHQFLGTDWQPITDPIERDTMAQRWVQRWSTPWSVAWHALELLDYDLNGEFGPWAPPAPFNGHPHWRDLPNLSAPWSQSEMLSYIDYGRQRVRETLEAMTDEKAATPLPPAHRYHGQPHAWIIVGLVGHTSEHAAQIRQFISSASGTPRL